MLKLLIVSLVSLGIGMGLGYGWQPAGETSLATASNMNIDAGENSNADYVQWLEAQNQQLISELAALRTDGTAQTKTAKAKIGGVEQLADNPAQSNIADCEAYYNMRKNTEDFGQYLQTAAVNNANGYVQDLATKFDAETVDNEWAPGYEDKLYRLLDSDEMATSVVAQSVVCKSRRCQIKIPITNLEQANEIMQSVSSAINSNQIGIDKSMVVSAPDIGAGIVNLYVVRDASVRVHE